MFEPSSKPVNANRALVGLTLADGTISNVSVRLPMTNKLADALNNADQFLDVVTSDGAQMFISKAEVKRACLVDVPKANHLNFNRRSADRAAAGPFAVLKLKAGASADEIRQAYHRMTRTYHPDRLSGLDLPEEVHEYARAMQVRINLAYEQIGG